MKKTLAVLIAFHSLSAFSSMTLRGTLSKSGSDYFVNSGTESLRIQTSGAILSTLPSLEAPSFMSQANKKPYTFQMKGEKKDGTFSLSETPTLIGGKVRLRGVLEFDEAQGTYVLDGHPLLLGYTKVNNGYSIDLNSIAGLKGQRIVADGEIGDNNEFLLQAFLPENLLSTSVSEVETEALDFVLKKMPLNEYSQSKNSFRKTLFMKDGHQSIKEGETALLITLSGRQGDSFGSVNGHFVAGLGRVNNEGLLDGEISNAYVTNDKDILSSHTDIISYFGHLVQGQNVYRPTYTLVVYGISPEKLQKFRDAMEESHITLRTQKLTITPEVNCTTETIKALKNVGIKGKYNQIDNYLYGLLSLPLKAIKPVKTLNYVFANDPSRYHPRTAFESFVRAFLNKKNLRKHDVVRVDYIFFPQIPSNRPVGGIALGNIWKVSKFKKLYEKYEVNPQTKVSAEELRPKLEEILNQIK